MAGLWYFWNNPGNTPGSKLVIPWSQLPPALGGTGAHGGAQAAGTTSPSENSGSGGVPTHGPQSNPSGNPPANQGYNTTWPQGAEPPAPHVPSVPPIPTLPTPPTFPPVQTNPVKGAGGRRREQPPPANPQLAYPFAGYRAGTTTKFAPFYGGLLPGQTFPNPLPGHSFHRLRGTTHPSSSNSNSTSQHTTCHAEKCG